MDAAWSRRVAIGALVVAVLAGHIGTAPAASAATGTTYHVDCEGDDARSGKSEADPWRTIARAEQNPLAPGDRLLFKRGCTWTGERLDVSWAGTARQPVVVGAYGNAADPMPKLRKGPNSNVRITGSHIVVEGLDVGYEPGDIPIVTTSGGCQQPVGDEYGFVVSEHGHHVTIQDSVASGAAVGVQVHFTASHVKVLRNQLTGNDAMSRFGTTTGMDLGASGVIVNGEDVEVGYNHFERNQAHCESIDPDRGTVLHSNSVEVYRSSRVSIHHNTSVEDRVFTELGSDVASGDLATDTTFAYNSMRSSHRLARFITTRGSLDTSYGPVLRTKALHNTVHFTGPESIAVACVKGCSSTVLSLRSNILVAQDRAVFADLPLDEARNVFWNPTLGPAVEIRGGGVATSSVVADPLFVDGAKGDLLPSAASPAIGRGTDSTEFTVDLAGVVIPQGDALESGALERPALGSDSSDGATPAEATTAEPTAVDTSAGPAATSAAPATSDHPYFVSVQNSAGTHLCGGSLLSTTKVLTAARCVDEDVTASSLRLVIGRSTLDDTAQGITRSVSAIVLHPDWTPTGTAKDVAVLTLAAPVTRTDPVEWLRLADPGDARSFDPGDDVTALGHGSACEPGCSPTPTLQSTSLPVRSDTEMTSIYGAAYVANVMLGAGGGTPSACPGDRGGPLLVPGAVDVQVGVASIPTCGGTDPGTYAEAWNGALRTFVNTHVKRPANDRLAAATALTPATGGARTGSLVNATVEPGEDSAHETSVWFKWTPTVSGEARITVGDHEFDSTVEVFTGVSVNALSLVAANNDANGSPQSSVVFHATEGKSYSIAVDGAGFDFGTFTLSYALDRAPNDDFADATALDETRDHRPQQGFTVESNERATAEAGEAKAAGNTPDSTLWWRWTAPSTGSVSFTTAGSTTATGGALDTVLSAWIGTSLSSLRSVASNNDFAGAKQSIITFPATAGTEYRIAVDGATASARGDVALQWDIGAPANDLFATPATISGSSGQMSSTTVGAVAEPGEPDHHGGYDNGSVWFSWRAPSSGRFRFATTGLADHVLAVYRGAAVKTLTPVASDDDTGVGLNPLVELDAVAGTVYRIAVEPFGLGAGGAFTLDWRTGGQPTLSIDDVFFAEGDTGTTEATFTLTLSGPSATVVVVTGTTEDDTAKSGSDYQATPLEVDIPIGAVTATVTVPVIGDSDVEVDETFLLRYAADGAEVLDPVAQATIRNDDTPVGETCDGLPATILGTGTIAGTVGDDVIVGSSAADTITGGGGTDHICGRGGDDKINAGSGDDRIFGEDGDDQLLSSALDGADRFDGGAGQDAAVYTNRPGRVVVTIDDSPNDGDAATGEGDNIMLTVERVVGGNGNDDITGSAAAENLLGGPGNDTLDGSGGPDILEGGAGDDTVRGGGGDDLLRMEATVDGADVLDGGAGVDEVNYFKRTATLGLTVSIDGVANDGVAGEGDNVMATVEDIVGGAGSDTLIGSSGNNALTGGLGNDTIRPEGGADVVAGGDGSDSIDVRDGVGGNDWVDGGAGIDTATSDAGDTVLNL